MTGPFVRWAMFPADVTPPPDVAVREWRQVMVQVTAPGPSDHGLVYVWTHTAGQVEALFSSALTEPVTLPNPFAPRYASQAELPTVAGTLTVIRGSGCGCSSPLKGANPLAGAI